VWQNLRRKEFSTLSQRHDEVLVAFQKYVPELSLSAKAAFRAVSDMRTLSATDPIVLISLEMETSTVKFVIDNFQYKLD
jgi:hypothetical protein